MRSLPPVLLLSALAACASRPLHPEVPRSSAASPEAAAPAPADVAIALESDPPLPGEPTEGWLGLETPTDEGASGHEHHGHHGHDGHGGGHEHAR